MGKSLPGWGSTLTSQNMWSHYSSLSITHSDPPHPYCSGLWNSSNLGEAPSTLWLKQPMASNTLLPMQKSSSTTDTTNGTQSSKSTNKPSWPKSNKKTMPSQALNTTWKRSGSTNASPTSRANWTSAGSSLLTTSPHIGKTLTATATVDQKVHPKGEVMLPPEQAAQLLPWYMQ